MSTTLPASRTSLVFVRGLVWAIIGLIYAPLFTALFVLFQAMGLGHWAFAPAAAIAGAVGAAFYSAREVALIGAVIGVERVFNYSGLGSTMLGAVGAHDVPVLQGAVLLVGIVYMLSTLLADLLIASLNPRVRLEATK